MHTFVLKVKIATIEILHEASHFNAPFKTQIEPLEHKIAQKVIYVTDQILDCTVQEI